MNPPNDKKTLDLLPEHDLAGERPRKLTSAEKAAIRAERYRETNGVRPVTLNMSADLVARLEAWIVVKDKGRTKSQVIAKLIETQLLRVR